MSTCGAKKNGTTAVCSLDHKTGEHKGLDNQGTLHTWMHDGRFDSA